MPFRFKDEDLVAKIGVAYGHDVTWDEHDQIVFPAPWKCYEQCIESHAEKSVPSADCEIAEKLPFLVI